ncbi:hypothetical protein HKX48_006068, partial [Thoreauomyces humboldtii]
MLQDPMETPLPGAPNYSSDARNFFQSDRDLEIEKIRELKKLHSSSPDAPGNPISLQSKVLAFVILEHEDKDVNHAYIAESAHVARKIDLN